MATPSEPNDLATTDNIVWATGHARDDYFPKAAAKRDALADAAHNGEWDRVFAELEHNRNWINAPRLGSRSGFAPLHQAAWHGAGDAVVRRLLDGGAWRTLRNADGARPVDIAISRRHRGLVELLSPDSQGFPEPSVTADIQTYLHALIAIRTRHYGGERRLWLPQVEPLLELPRGCSLWCPVPGMYGGFNLRWDGDAVVSESWCRIVGGSAQVHRITSDGVELIEDGAC